MCIEAHGHTRQESRQMGLIRLAIAPILILMAAAVSYSQSQNTTPQPPAPKSRVIILRLGGDQIGTVKTAEKLSTRISFCEPVKEIICGDLYDATSGTGSFVVQRIDNDVFIKPVAPKGESNMFVKAGDRGEHTYNFALVIVPSDQAYLIVKVTYAPENLTGSKNDDKPQQSTSHSTVRIDLLSVVPKRF